MTDNKVKPDQSAEFLRVAREIGADEERSNADALLGRLSTMPPNPKPKRRLGVKKKKPGKKPG